MTGDETVIEFDIDDQVLLSCARDAHNQGITLNEYFVRAIYRYLLEIKDSEIQALRAAIADLENDL